MIFLNDAARVLVVDTTFKTPHFIALMGDEYRSFFLSLSLPCFVAEPYVVHRPHPNLPLGQHQTQHSSVFRT
jgi:hypothetical protein